MKRTGNLKVEPRVLGFAFTFPFLIFKYLTMEGYRVTKDILVALLCLGFGKNRKKKRKSKRTRTKSTNLIEHFLN